MENANAIMVSLAKIVLKGLVLLNSQSKMENALKENIFAKKDSLEIIVKNHVPMIVLGMEYVDTKENVFAIITLKVKIVQL